MTETHAAYRAIAFELVRLEERCQEVPDYLLRPEDELGMFEGRGPWDLPTELRTRVESLLEGEIRPAIECLERACPVTRTISAGSSGRRGTEKEGQQTHD